MVAGSFKYARVETRDSKKTGHDHGEGKRQACVHRQKDRLAKGRKGLDKKRFADCPLPPPSCLPLVAGVFRSCWNAILRIPGRDGKSTGGQFVRTARCRRRRDLKVDTFRVRVRTADVYIFIRACINEIYTMEEEEAAAFGRGKRGSAFISRNA